MVFQLNKLELEKASLLELQGKRRCEYEQCMDLQVFQRDCAQMDVIMAKQEVMLLYLHVYFFVFCRLEAGNILTKLSVY